MRSPRPLPGHQASEARRPHGARSGLHCNERRVVQHEHGRLSRVPLQSTAQPLESRVVHVAVVFVRDARIQCHDADGVVIDAVVQGSFRR